MCKGWTLFDPIKRTFHALSCMRWRCPDCSQRKAEIWSTAVDKAQPNKFLTMTRPGSEHFIYKSGSHIDFQRKCTLDLAEFIKLVRRHLDNDFAYWGVTAPHRSGVPHAHFVVRSDYLPWKTLQWFGERVGWGRSTHIKSIPVGWTSAKYCTEHLINQPNRLKFRARIRSSQNFFPKGSKPFQVSPYSRYSVIKLDSDNARDFISFLTNQPHSRMISPEVHTQDYFVNKDYSRNLKMIGDLHDAYSTVL